MKYSKNLKGALPGAPFLSAHSHGTPAFENAQFITDILSSMYTSAG
ncbi:hypothetical protein ACFS7Z_11760 [Pontibacter toksunensis]|uniref:Uncharacterized protein n=1 Tax=Pontibacter toksunensis TaxID=1332631 RepID=A0ABW6BT95_9BACT